MARFKKKRFGHETFFENIEIIYPSERLLRDEGSPYLCLVEKL